MAGDDRLARGVALVVLALFLAAQVISYIDPMREMPVELYPLGTLALGYLLGVRILQNGKNGKK